LETTEKRKCVYNMHNYKYIYIYILIYINRRWQMKQQR
jgi:hypothetical protein